MAWLRNLYFASMDMSKHFVRSKPVRALIWAICITTVAAIWISSIWFVPVLADFVEGQRSSSAVGESKGLDRYGLVGDMFGAINALFSGLALGAIALTLWVESKSRRQARRPLVMAGVDSGDIVIGRPFGDGAATTLHLFFPITLSNQSMDAALNVAARIQIMVGSRPVANAGLNGPLLRDSDQEAKLEVVLRKSDWEPLLVELTSQREVEVTLTTTYRSLEGVNWKTVVTHQIFVRTEDQHYELLDAVRNGTWNREGVWQDDALVAVSSRIKQGSWDHGLG